MLVKNYYAGKKPRSRLNRYRTLFGQMERYYLDGAVEEVINKEVLKEKLSERKIRLNRDFVWSPENTRKIIELNNGLIEIYRKAYNDMVGLKAAFDAMIESGKTYAKGYWLELKLWYEDPLVWEDGQSEEAKLWDNLSEFTDDWGVTGFHATEGTDSPIRPFEEVAMIDDQSWTDAPFGAPELDGTYIYYCMHAIFNHNGTFSLEDAVKMKLENFAYNFDVNFDGKKNE